MLNLVLFDLTQYQSQVNIALAVIAASIAVISIMSSRDLSRKKNSVDIILESKRDQRLEKAYKRVREIDEDGQADINKFAEPKNQGLDEAVDIRYVLNHYEYIAVGINMRIYDEETIKRSECTIIINLFTRTERFIIKSREFGANPKFWKELEELVNKWKLEPLKIDHITTVRWWQFW